MSARSILAVIADAVANAALNGEDEIGQYRMAVRAANVADPDRPDASVARLVNGLLETRDPNGVAPSAASYGGNDHEDASGVGQHRRLSLVAIRRKPGRA